ncbi:hypothetical protein [Pseudonocardia xishanensis]|uniref:GAF domain-containing protein n=1 Tax=Pseudonocardia xishanensis TaxID=630995 RepID=A0ABP8RQ93_9PSEU
MGEDAEEHRQCDHGDGLIRAVAHRVRRVRRSRAPPPPMSARAAAGIGARGMVVFPLQVGADRSGVLDCYRDTGELGTSALTTALRAADMAV